jgi:glycerate 2-kinase
MKILIAPDSFKDCMTARQVALFIEKGILKEMPDADIENLPISDGGEGTLTTLVEATGGILFKTQVHDPLMRMIDAEYGILGDGITGVIEMATASGLELLSNEERNPWITTSYGTGELIKALLNHGCKRIIIGLGGSATNDAGVGMAIALGFRFPDIKGEIVDGKGGELSKILKIETSEIDKRIFNTEIIVACDVTNPFFGPSGASIIYGPQKGADPKMAQRLDQNLMHFSKILKTQTGKDIDNIPGSGAAGGMGGILLALLNAQLHPGFETVSSEVGLENRINRADLIFTGEGRIDSQTHFGKTIAGVGRLAKKYNKPVIAIAGSLGEGYEKIYDSGISSVFSIIDKPMNLNEAILQTPELIEKCSRSVIRSIQVRRNFRMPDF